MKILLIGSGGREYVMVKRLMASKSVSDILVVPGSDGIERLLGRRGCVIPSVKSDDAKAIVELAVKEKSNLVVIGPEDPLVFGVADLIRGKGIPVFGLGKNTARIEGSKIFAKNLMTELGMPTADYKVFLRDQYEEALKYVCSLELPYVIKADKLAAGKGAFIIRDYEIGKSILKFLMVDDGLAGAGRDVVIEDFIKGEEGSIIGFIDETNIRLLQPAQDHKALKDNDEGLNTGGMGAYAPTMLFSLEELEYIKETFFLPIVERAWRKGRNTRGALYAGLIKTKDGKVYNIEYNARFGDPETQAQLYNFESDFAQYCLATAEGNLGKLPAPAFKPGYAVNVVLAAEGYPGPYLVKGSQIFGIEEVEKMENVEVVLSGVAFIGKNAYVDGGRFMGITGYDPESFQRAQQRAYEAVALIRCKGMHFRTDIGNKMLKYL